MYTPAFSREHRVELLHDAIDGIRFGTLITVGSDGPLATHIPMFVVREPAPNGIIFGHIARANAQWQLTPRGSPALAAFVGPQAYITPSWYETKRETGKVVPTWQYLAVQARGPIEFFDEVERLHDLVRRSTVIQERQREHPWAVEDAPEDYVQRQLRAIVGFEMKVMSLEGAWKLGQNKSAADRKGVVQGLEDADAGDLAKLVRASGPLTQE